MTINKHDTPGWRGNTEESNCLTFDGQIEKQVISRC